MKLSAERCSQVSDRPEVTGRVINIQRFSIHDGPGTRTVLFMKGCQMRCAWCANPESQDLRPEVFVDESKCDGCARCQPYRRAFFERPDVALLPDHTAPDFTACRALKRTSEIIALDEVMARLRRDEPFYRLSGGGVTLSGGEAALQPDFCRAVITACREEGLHTAVETAGFASWKNVWLTCGQADLILYDLKMSTDELHVRYTGVSNRRIIRNLEMLLEAGKKVRIRVPVIPGVNDTETESDRLMALIRSTTLGYSNFDGIDLLPYHRYGVHKYRMLGKSYPFETRHNESRPADMAVMKNAALRWMLMTNEDACVPALNQSAHFQER
jgi:pyruvate formate lyase activating enzyme